MLPVAQSEEFLPQPRDRAALTGPLRRAAGPSAMAPGPSLCWEQGTTKRLHREAKTASARRTCWAETETQTEGS